MKEYWYGGLLGMAMGFFFCVVCPPAPLLTAGYSGDCWIDVNICSSSAGVVCLAEDYDGSQYFLQKSRWSFDSSDRTIYDQLRMGKNRVHIASWQRRDNHRWLKVIDGVDSGIR